jgi:ASTRA-associated protein 1
MVMTVSLLYITGKLTLVAGFESGFVAVKQVMEGKWMTVYRYQAHSQPVLSVDVDDNLGIFISSGADSKIVKHPLTPKLTRGSGSTGADFHQTPLKELQTHHAGQQGLRIRDDGRLFATAGWDGMIRVFGTETSMKALAVLKWHQVGCYATAFASVGNPPIKHTADRVENATPTTQITSMTRNTELTVKEKRIQHAKGAHWLAAGSKDGKISLWDIF